MPPIDILDETGREASLAEDAVRAGAVILEAVSRSDAELSVVLVGDERMRELNREWRGKDRATDVLSFGQNDDSGSASGETPGESGETPAMLGDVVISVETLRRQAEDGGWTEAEELARLLLHGVLHLLGHDHENDDDAQAMRAEENRVIARLVANGIACASASDPA